MNFSVEALYLLLSFNMELIHEAHLLGALSGVVYSSLARVYLDKAP
ncbi:MAG: hypothetical protein ACNYNY_02455 [Candidatus Oxydemutatoraceae bacterium WSBS_2016_MAG_OTU14]